MMTDKTKLNSHKKVRYPKRPERDARRRAKRLTPLLEWVRTERLRWFILIALSLIISFFLFPSILTKPKVYKLGDVAEADIKASHDFLVEDKAQTENHREKAVKEVLSVYDFDRSASNLATRLKEAFSLGRAFLSKSAAEGGVGSEKTATVSVDQKPPSNEAEEMIQLKNRFFGLLEIPPKEDMFETLLSLRFPSQIEKAVMQLIKVVIEKGVVSNRQMLESQIEKGGIVLHEIFAKSEITVRDFNLFYDLQSAKQHIVNQTETINKWLKNPEENAVAITLAQALLKPNLTYNQRETESRKDQARTAIKPTYFKIKRGEMLVREGELIGPDHLIKLTEQSKSKSQNRVDMIGCVPAMTILIGMLFSVIYIIGFKGPRTFRGEGRDLLFNSLTLLGLFIFIWAYDFVAEEIARGFYFLTQRALLYAMPVACGSILISIFQGIGMATTFSLAISVLGALITGGKVEFFLYFFISSLVAAYGVKDCRERGILIKTGLIVGLINIILALSIEMINSSFYSIESTIAASSGFIGGILAGVIATGILPLIEMSFGFTTDIKLLELANLDQPLLRSLMVQAPGTYHHSVITSSMVEATAKAVNANPLLARVSAYYHDIGKMKKPLYFIENQMGGENRHEKLAPSMSSLILISHVKDGVELAKENKIGREIIDIIQQHHGTSLISFFYQKAKDRMVVKGGKATEIKEEDFRYPGPKPQTKEAGLVMLADMVEAATRSLVDPTPARIQGLVQKMINKVFSDGQLDECELTLKDLHEIAKSFNKTLSGIFHQRVEYPEMVTRFAKKGRNGDTDQLSTEATRPKRTENREELDEGLKRLGL